MPSKSVKRLHRINSITVSTVWTCIHHSTQTVHLHIPATWLPEQKRQNIRRVRNELHQTRTVTAIVVSRHQQDLPCSRACVETHVTHDFPFLSSFPFSQLKVNCALSVGEASVDWNLAGIRAFRQSATIRSDRSFTYIMSFFTRFWHDFHQTQSQLSPRW